MSVPWDEPDEDFENWTIDEISNLVNLRIFDTVSDVSGLVS